MPSLHVGFAVAIGIAVAAAVRNPLAQGSSRSCGARSSASPSSPPATTSCSTSSPASLASARGLRRRQVVARASGAARSARGDDAAPGVRRGLTAQRAVDGDPAPPTIASASAGADDSQRRAVRRRGAALGRTAAGDRPKLAASIATLAPTDAGANGHKPPPPWVNATSSRRPRRDGHAERGEEARERAGPAPRGSPAATAAPRARRRRAAQRRAAAADAGEDRAAPARSRGRGDENEREQRNGSPATARAGRRHAELGPDPGQDTATASSTMPMRYLPGALGHERPRQTAAHPAVRHAGVSENSTRTARPRRARTRGRPHRHPPSRRRPRRVAAGRHAPREPRARAPASRIRASPGWPGATPPRGPASQARRPPEPRRSRYRHAPGQPPDRPGRPIRAIVPAEAQLYVKTRPGRRRAALRATRPSAVWCGHARHVPQRREHLLDGDDVAVLLLRCRSATERAPPASGRRPPRAARSGASPCCSASTTVARTQPDVVAPQTTRLSRPASARRGRCRRTPTRTPSRAPARRRGGRAARRPRPIRVPGRSARSAGTLRRNTAACASRAVVVARSW